VAGLDERLLAGRQGPRPATPSEAGDAP